MNLILEQGRESDLDELERLYDTLNDHLAAGTNYPGWRKGFYPTRQTAVDGLNAGGLYLARAEGRIAGSVILLHEPEAAYAQAKWGIDADYKDLLVVHTVAVHPDFLGRGVGRSLIELALDQGRAQQVKALRLDVHEHNEPAIRLYESCGFQYVDTVDLGLGEFGLKWFRLYEKMIGRSRL